MSSRMEELGSQVVTWEVLTKAQRIFHGQVMEQVYREIILADRERQTREDYRANKRNFNRMLTVLTALFVGLAITWTLQNLPIPHGHILGEYSFVITVAFDVLVTGWSWIRHY